MRTFQDGHTTTRLCQVLFKNKTAKNFFQLYLVSVFHIAYTVNQYEHTATLLIFYTHYHSGEKHLRR